MFALEGIYENGVVSLLKKGPVAKARVLIIFPQEQIRENLVDKDLQLFETLSGSIKENINIKAELLEAVDEKYATADAMRCI